MFWVLLGCAALLLAFQEAVSAAAADGAMLWWTRVFPALLPHLILSNLVLRARPAFTGRLPLHPYAMLSAGLGALGGYPVGARVLAEGVQSGAITEREAQRFSYASGWMSPAFLISFTAIGLFGLPASIPALCASVYGVALVALLVCGRGKGTPMAARRLTADDLGDAIAEAMTAILRVGGCIVLCRVLGAALEGVGVIRWIGMLLPGTAEIARTVLTGLLEITGGCTLAAALPLPLAMRLSLCVFFQVLGGASVLLQTRAFLRSIRFGRYVLVRLCMAIASALLCFALCSLLPDPLVTASATTDAALARAKTLLGLVVSGAMGLLLVPYWTLLRCASAEHGAQDIVGLGGKRKTAAARLGRQHNNGRVGHVPQRTVKAEQLP